MQAWRAAFGTAAPRRASLTVSLPYRGSGVRPDGGVTLAVTGKALIPKDLGAELRRGAIPESNAQLDSVSLSAAEWSSLAPPDARVGSQWTIPQAVGRRFFPILSFTETVFRDPAEVTEVQLSGRVASVRDGIAHLVYQGRIAGHFYDPKSVFKELEFSSAVKLIAGVASYDIRAGQMLALTWVGEGLFRPGTTRPPPSRRPGSAP